MLDEFKFSITLLQSYLKWIANISSAEGGTALVLFLVFVLCAISESYFPRQKPLAGQLRQSYRTNIELFVFNSLVISLLSIPSLLALAERYSDKGLLNYVSNPAWKATLSFLAMDLLLYGVHKASHSFDCLWMFHKVHHNDRYLNVSTAFRIHFAEIIIINLIKALLIVVLGIQSALVLANEAIITFFTMLHHTNISFRGERFLGLVIITPYLHRAHHSVQRDEHDNNYGSVLSIWDRLFGTLAELKPAQIGINGNSPQDMINLIKYGFTWVGSSSVRAVDLDKMIAEAAYYKAEKRDFRPGNELKDWLEAKREIIGSAYADKPGKNKLVET
jgi:sterol desaturase/sphingolipid hydroxylase (fatty acid hydroxylase superfamily)